MSDTARADRAQPVPDEVDLAGISVHAVTADEAADAVIDLAREDRGALVVTPNVDHVVRLEHDQRFRAAYRDADLRLVDGAPLVALSRLSGRPVPGRVTGADLFGDVCARAADEHLKVFIAGGAPDVLDEGIRRTRQRFPGLRVEGHSPPMGFEGTEHDRELQERIAEADPDIVMVCFGAPRSEVWAAQRRRHQPATFLCVGAAIDFAAGARRRAPAWMQRAGLEWAYRVLQEPRRLWRRYAMGAPAFLRIAVRDLWRSRVRPSAG
jgi:N-acetylglucosaminyldiphosphoundecaprenol N-acetyl-beta-D-mannosaminyltransferase